MINRRPFLRSSFSAFALGLAVVVAGWLSRASCAQTQRAPVSPQRKVELMIRSRFDLPVSCGITLGQRTASAVNGFDELPVTITEDGKNFTVDFLISKDGKTLARLDEYDLDSNPALSIDLRGRPMRGNPRAPVTIVSFDDLECPVCARQHQLLLPAILNQYGDKVRVIYKDNPLVDLHPWALHAAVDANCLASQSAAAYWNFIDYIHTHAYLVTGESRQLDASFSTLDQMAADQGQRARLDAPVLGACLKRQNDAPVRQSMKEARGLGLNFAPALFVNGEELRGLTSPEALSTAVGRALRESTAASDGRKTGQR